MWREGNATGEPANRLGDLGALSVWRLERGVLRSGGARVLVGWSQIDWCVQTTAPQPIG
jgi:hypothetical protein